MNSALRKELVEMEQHDQVVRGELAANGTLFEGYHPRMQAVHKEHAKRLRHIIGQFGWPTETMVGPEGAKAAWLIAQHAIGEPDFMRQCRKLLEDASNHGEVPRWQFAFIDDRIRVFEGRPQKFGTQLCEKDGVLQAYPLEDEVDIERLRHEAGLPPLTDILEQARSNPPPGVKDPTAKDSQELAWRREVGWIVD
jgi:hypothetical protein